MTEANSIPKPQTRKPRRRKLNVLRVERARNGLRMFEAKEIRAIVQGALVVGKDGPELVRAAIPCPLSTSRADG